MLRQLGLAALKLRGWRLGSPPPDLPKFVLITVHTSNWDGWYFLLYALAFQLRASWVGKDALFAGPLGTIGRALGGIPVDRKARRDLVAQLAAEFNQRDRLVLAIAPEGTRDRVDYWRSGFYHLARAAKVPIVPGVIDYKKRIGGFGPPIYPTDDLKADMDRLRAFYADLTPCKPELAGPIRLKEELR